MKFSTPFKTVCILTLSGLLFVPTLQAGPNTSVKTTLTRKENPTGDSKNSLVMPYAFSTKSMGSALGVGGETKGYDHDQLLLGVTVFGIFDKVAALFPGMWDYRPSFAKRFFLSTQGMVGHYPENRAFISSEQYLGATHDFGWVMPGHPF